MLQRTDGKMPILVVSCLFFLASGPRAVSKETLPRATLEERMPAGGKTAPMRITVAAAQMPVTSDIPANVETIGRAIDRASAGAADILLTPEGSVSGYTHQFDQAATEAAVARLVREAQSHNLALALGTCYIEPDDGRCYNQIRFYSKSGVFLGFHSKILRCGTMDEPARGEIHQFATQQLRTFQIEGITVGGLICNDMWANPMCTPMADPHLSQQLSQLGARIIFHAINGGRDGGDWSKNVYWPFHETNLRMRARAGRVWIVAADSCQPTNIPCSAPSGVLRPDGSWVARAPDHGESVVIHAIVLE